MTKSITEYESTIKKMHDTLQQHEDGALKKRLKRQVVSWVNLIEIGVRVASNEQKPWTEQELELFILPMPLKKEIGHAQTGDYQFEIITGNDVVTGGLVVERKEVSDLYNTLMKNTARTRFNKELDRYHKDPRFDTMAILVEGTMSDFMNYIPEVYICRLNTIPGVGTQKLVDYLERYYKIEGLKPTDVQWNHDNSSITVDKTVVCGNAPRLNIGKSITIRPGKPGEYNLEINGILKDTLQVDLTYGKQALYQRKGAAKESKWGSIARLDAKGIPIRWCGSRDNAIKYYKYLITHWCIANYDKILNLKRD